MTCDRFTDSLFIPYGRPVNQPGSWVSCKKIAKIFAGAFPEKEGMKK